MSAIPFVKSQFKVRAVIGGVSFPDVVAISATFGLNAIPAASLIVATGVNVKTGQKATIHDAKNQLRPRDTAKVYLTVETTDGQKDKMPAGEFLIFDGFYVGLGYQRSFNNANYELHLVHWLDDLNNSSMLNGNWFPGAPFDLAQNAAYHVVDTIPGAGATDPAAAGAPRWSTVPAVDPYGNIITPTNVQADMWEKILKPVFTAVANFPAPRYQSDSGTQKNDAALAALARMPGKGQPHYSPLALDITGLESKSIQYAIQQAVSKDALESFAYTTFWSKLIGEYAAQFFFAISPSVEFALPVPFFAGLRKPYKEIRADEYGYANFNASMSQVLESVDIFFGPQPSITNYALGGETGRPPTLFSPAGFYPLRANQNKKGLKLLKEPPGWMVNFIPESVFAGRSSGVTAQPVGDTAAPQTGEKNPPPSWLPPEEALREQLSSRALSRFAEHYFKTEVLSQRFGELSGKLRFDIAPGSVVQIEIPPRDKPPGGWFSAPPEDSLYATVTQVSYVINAEKATAGTSFTLAHIRSHGENQDNLYTNCETCDSPERPPIYKKTWAGGPLALKVN